VDVDWTNNKISKSTDEAEDKVDKLCDLVEQTLEQNRVLAERLASDESGSAVAQIGTEQRRPGDGSIPAEEQQQKASSCRICLTSQKRSVKCQL
jgi:hypothetical protein